MDNVSNLMPVSHVKQADLQPIHAESTYSRLINENSNGPFWNVIE